MPLCASIILILVAGMFAGAGTLAQFYDTEKVGVDDIKAGTLNLRVRSSLGSDDPCIIHVTIDEIKPGDHVEGPFGGPNLYTIDVVLENLGNLPGKLSIEISDIKNYENDCLEPEWNHAGDIKDDPEGELGANLKIKFFGLVQYGMYPASGTYDCLNDLGGMTFAEFIGEPPERPLKILEPNEKESFVMDLELPSDVDNIVQSDSVEFDIIFHLDQA